MNFESIAVRWAQLEKSATILIITESGRLGIARQIAADNEAHVSGVEICDIAQDSGYAEKMRGLGENDLVIALLTVDGYVFKDYAEIFSPFHKPDGVRAKYIFIKCDISARSLYTGLQTPAQTIDDIIADCTELQSGMRVRVTGKAGTDITMKIDRVNPYKNTAAQPGGFAFLPPTDYNFDLEYTCANGTIVVDTTVGELRFHAELIDRLGLVDENVVIGVEDGLVTSITGGEIARRLKSGFDRRDKALQVLVELGVGLSDMEPTGEIGIDECIAGTCHFGIGDRSLYHIDVVVREPKIDVITT